MGFTPNEKVIKNHNYSKTQAREMMKDYGDQWYNDKITRKEFLAHREWFRHNITTEERDRLIAEARQEFNKLPNSVSSPAEVKPVEQPNPPVPGPSAPNPTIAPPSDDSMDDLINDLKEQTELDTEVNEPQTQGNDDLIAELAEQEQGIVKTDAETIVPGKPSMLDEEPLDMQDFEFYSDAGMEAIDFSFCLMLQFISTDWTTKGEEKYILSTQRRERLAKLLRRGLYHEYLKTGKKDINPWKLFVVCIVIVYLPKVVIAVRDRNLLIENKRLKDSLEQAKAQLAKQQSQVKTLPGGSMQEIANRILQLKPAEQQQQEQTETLPLPMLPGVTWKYNGDGTYTGTDDVGKEFQFNPNSFYGAKLYEGRKKGVKKKSTVPPGQKSVLDEPKKSTRKKAQGKAKTKR